MAKPRAGGIHPGKIFVRTATVLVLIGGMMPLVTSTSYAWRVPRTLHEVVRASQSASGAVLGPGLLQRALPFAATDLGVTWKGSGPPPSLRTSSDGVNWTTWKRVTESIDMFDPRTGTHFSDLLAGRDARLAQIAQADSVQQGSLALAVINTRDGPLRSVRLERTAVAATSQPAVISRRAWGADESIRKGQPGFAPIKKIFVHHTVTPNNADPAATMRAIYTYHVQARGWEDIGYNFLIDSRGNTYEGRYSRPYSSGETPTGEDSAGRGVVGAHTEGQNVGSTGIALLGDAESRAPSKAAIDALVNAVAWKAGRNGIDPTGSDRYGGESFPNVSGHRDSPSASTECPGAHLYSTLPSVRERAKQMIGSPRGAGGGPLGGVVGPILNAPAPGLGDSVAGILKGIGL